jgi:pyruvate/2-oxoglutarate dehydrogenase complex dihydrolipoamide dehydrogenase (E3) component
MGVGGEEVAGRLAEAGLEVVGIEANLVGGECPYWGCVPSKMMIRAANLLAETRRVPGMAGESSVRPDWTPVASRIRDEATDNWDDRVAVERFEAKGGRFVRGRARLTGPGTVEVDGRTVTARRGLVVATGTKPSVPPIPGLADVDYWTNREAIETTTVPRSLVVLGGGAIGAELAQVFARFGSNVTVVEALDRLLPPEEPEASELIAAVFARQGLTVRTGKRAENVVQSGGRIIITLSDGDCVEGDKVLVATGRHVDLGTLGLSAIGVDPQARAIPVDGHMRVAPGVWAVGDVTGVGAFTHVAMYQAHVAVADILGKDHAPADYRALPRVTFTDPEVGSVGITELAARESGLPVRTGQAALPSSARGWIHKAGNDGLIKLVADTKRDVLVGATSIGPAGGEVLGLLALAVHAQVPVPVLRQMIFAYPTFHRAVEAALEDLAA